MMRRKKAPAKPDPDTQRGTGRALATAYEPELAAIDQFDDLIAKLSTPRANQAPKPGA